MILNKSQAEAIYSAMVALNNVSASMWQVSDDNLGFTLTVSKFTGEIDIKGKKLGNRETYPDQLSFAAAYGIN